MYNPRQNLGRPPGKPPGRRLAVFALLLSGLFPSLPASGTTVTKILYPYNNQTLTRTSSGTTATPAVTIAGGGTASADWDLSPVIPTGETLTLPAQTVTTKLVIANTGNQTIFARPATVELLQFVSLTSTTTSLGTSTAVSTFGGNALYTFSTSIPATSFAAGDYLIMRVHNTAPQGPRSIAVTQFVSGTGQSTISITTTTFINVDSVSIYSASYPATTTQSTYAPGSTVYIRAVVSDPFGSYDVDPSSGGTAPTLVLKDANGTIQIAGLPMTQVADSGVATKIFEYYVSGTTGYTLANNAVQGVWTATVTAYEGTEGTVNATGSGTFFVNATALEVTKSVTSKSDPVEGTTQPKAIPGSVIQYSVLVQNNGVGAVDSGSLTITDPIPTNTAFYWTTAGEFAFTDGSPASGLSSPVISFSNNNGTSYTYTPSCVPTASVPCTDTAINNIKFTFTGSMSGKSGATAPSFTVTFTVVIQ